MGDQIRLAVLHHPGSLCKPDRCSRPYGRRFPRFRKSVLSGYSFRFIIHFLRLAGVKDLHKIKFLQDIRIPLISLGVHKTHVLLPAGMGRSQDPSVIVNDRDQHLHGIPRSSRSRSLMVSGMITRICPASGYHIQFPSAPGNPDTCPLLYFSSNNDIPHKNRGLLPACLRIPDFSAYGCTAQSVLFHPGILPGMTMHINLHDNLSFPIRYSENVRLPAESLSQSLDLLFRMIRLNPWGLIMIPLATGISTFSS